MEIEGHPTQDLVEELERRGSIAIVGGTDGPDQDAVRFLQEKLGAPSGRWLFIPTAAYDTGFDDKPG